MLHQIPHMRTTSCKLLSQVMCLPLLPFRNTRLFGTLHPRKVSSISYIVDAEDDDKMSSYIGQLVHKGRRQEEYKKTILDTCSESSNQFINAKTETNFNVPHDTRLQKLVDSNFDEALTHCQRYNISNCKLNFASLVKLINAASMTGNVALVLKIHTLAHATVHPLLLREVLNLNQYMAMAKFRCGFFSDAFRILHRIYELPPPALDDKLDVCVDTCQTYIAVNCPTTKGCCLKDPLYRKPENLHFIQHEELINVTRTIFMKVPEVNRPHIWDQAEALARQIIKHRQHIHPAYTLWRSFFFSPGHTEFVRADAMMERENCLQCAFKVQFNGFFKRLFMYGTAKHVHHTLELLLKYKEPRFLPQISSLLITIHCGDGNSNAALEVFHFTRDLKIPVSANALARLQHLLYQRQIPVPQEIMRAKYDKPRNYIKKPPPYPF